MSSFYTDISNDIINNDEYCKAIDLLFSAYIKKTIGDKCSIERNVVKKLTTAIQYFYQSENELHRREGAEILSMLLLVAAETIPELVVIAEHVFNEAGDFPNIDLLNRKYNNIHFKVSIFDEIERNLRKSMNTVNEISHTLTNYQRNLWEHLTSGVDIITSAPTSTGKTYLILKYLVDKVYNSSGSFAVVVVPTRALIAEVAAKVFDLTKELSCEDEIEICTYPKEGEFKK